MELEFMIPSFAWHYGGGEREGWGLHISSRSISHPRTTTDIDIGNAKPTKKIRTTKIHKIRTSCLQHVQKIYKHM